jgi:hypothetical protein
MQHQPLAHSITVNGTRVSNARGRDVQDVCLDYYGNRGRFLKSVIAVSTYFNLGWNGGTKMPSFPLPSVYPERRTPTPIKDSAKRARAGTVAPKSRSVKKPRGSASQAMRMNTKMDENASAPDINLDDDGDPADEVMQTTRWSADEKTLLFECILGPNSDNILELLKTAPKAACEKASLEFVCESHTHALSSSQR